MNALSRKQTAHFLTTLTLVNAIIQVGNVIAAAASGSSSSNQDGLNKTITSLREFLLPEEIVERESAAQKAMRLFQKELAKDPIYATPQSASKKGQSRGRRSGSVNGSSGRK